MKQVNNRNKIIKNKVAAKKTRKKPLFGTSKLEEKFAKDFLEKLDTKIEDLNKQMLEQKEKEWVKIRAAWKAVNEVHAQLQIERAFARSIIIIAIVCIICSVIVILNFF